MHAELINGAMKFKFVESGVHNNSRGMPKPFTIVMQIMVLMRGKARTAKLGAV